MAVKRRRKRKYSSINPRHMFNSPFDEKKVMGYLHNLIKSRFVHYKTETLFEFSNKVLGDEVIIDCLEKSHPKIVEEKKFADWIRDEILAEHIPDRTLTRFLRNIIAPVLLKRSEKSSLTRLSGIKKRLQNLKETFCLTSDELEIVTFYFLMETCPLVEDYMGRHGDIYNFQSLSTLKNHGKAVLGLKQHCLKNTLSKGALFKADIIDISSPSSLELDDWCIDYLIGVGKDDLSHEFFTNDNNETLQVTDFDIPENDMVVLKTLIKTKGRQNILLYGEPGTGKTSFTRSFAKGYEKELYTVKNSKSDNHKDRLNAIYATVNLADKESSLVLIDEADEILNSYKSLFFESKTNKSWINSFLESHDKKVVWITNRVSEIDASTMRRFAFSIEFRKFSHKNRLKVLNHCLKKQRLNGYFSDEELNELCNSYQVNAGGIIDAINLLKISRKANKEKALENLKTVLKNHEKVTNGGKAGNTKTREFRNYSLDGLNTSQNLTKIISVMKQYVKRKDWESNIKNNCSITSLLYGLPGTGKSEFVYYLGNLLNKEVLLKRCSEIQSMWVGEAEKNIAGAFYEAQESDSILFFDEADTFLFPRQNASQSWEKSFTNEILTQIESFTGIVIFATNDMEGLDHAALRRFKFKIEFLPLTPEGNLRLYNSLLKPLAMNNKEITDREIRQIKTLRNLTPGDFAVVKDQNIFVDQNTITHQWLIDSLRNEVVYKKTGDSIGFLSN